MKKSLNVGDYLSHEITELGSVEMELIEGGGWISHVGYFIAGMLSEVFK